MRHQSAFSCIPVQFMKSSSLLSRFSVYIKMSQADQVSLWVLPSKYCNDVLHVSNPAIMLFPFRFCIDICINFVQRQFMQNIHTHHLQIPLVLQLNKWGKKAKRRYPSPCVSLLALVDTCWAAVDDKFTTSPNCPVLANATQWTWGTAGITKLCENCGISHF